MDDVPQTLEGPFLDIDKTFNGGKVSKYELDISIPDRINGREYVPSACDQITLKPSNTKHNKS